MSEYNFPALPDLPDYDHKFWKFFVGFGIFTIFWGCGVSIWWDSHLPTIGKTAMFNGQVVRVIASGRTDPETYFVRLPDNTEIRVTWAELSPVAEKN
jgi:hypothetical protein